MGDFAKMVAAKRAMTPSAGANLVGVDTYEDPGDELYLIGHYDTEAEAEKAQRERKRKHPDEILYVYGPEACG